MEENTEKENKDIFELFSEFTWADRLTIDRTKKRISITGTEEVIFEIKNNKKILKFYLFDDDSKEIKKRLGHPEVLECSAEIDMDKIIEFWNNTTTGNSGYMLCYKYGILKRILLMSENNIEKIKISGEYTKITTNKNKKEILLPLNTLIEIKNEANEIDRVGSSRKQSIERYLTNLAIKKYLNKKIQDVTTVDRGDFAFLIDRFNLGTKKTESDFKKYLNDTDITKIEEFTDAIIRKEIFSKEYLRRLDDYFIKERLSDILYIGKEILALKSEDIKTNIAKKVIKLFDKNKDIKQMESIWQEFFKNYLLYLIFTYKKIIPKVELEVESIKKKFPDFVGINHYNGVDIIEIKTHLKNILVWDESHENFAFSSEMSKAIVQTLNYIDAVSRKRFKKESEQKDILENLTEEENLYHPRGIIIISSKNNITKSQGKLTASQKNKLERDFTKLRNSIQNIEIITFDEVLSIAEKYVENIRTNYEN